MKTKIVFSEKCLRYGTWHVEGPQRIKLAHEILMAKGYDFLEPTPLEEDELLRVHDGDYLWNLKKRHGGRRGHASLRQHLRIRAALRCGAVLAAKIGGFSLMRPPGHHAGVFGQP